MCPRCGCHDFDGVMCPKCGYSESLPNTFINSGYF